MNPLSLHARFVGRLILISSISTVVLQGALNPLALDAHLTAACPFWDREDGHWLEQDSFSDFTRALNLSRFSTMHARERTFGPTEAEIGYSKGLPTMWSQGPKDSRRRFLHGPLSQDWILRMSALKPEAGIVRCLMCGEPAKHQHGWAPCCDGECWFVERFVEQAADRETKRQ
jgi:hypothetical protein